LLALAFILIHTLTRKRSIKSKVNAFVGSITGNSLVQTAEEILEDEEEILEGNFSQKKPPSTYSQVAENIRRKYT